MYLLFIIFTFSIELIYLIILMNLLHPFVNINSSYLPSSSKLIFVFMHNKKHVFFLSKNTCVLQKSSSVWMLTVYYWFGPKWAVTIKMTLEMLPELSWLQHIYMSHNSLFPQPTSSIHLLLKIIAIFFMHIFF